MRVCVSDMSDMGDRVILYDYLLSVACVGIFDVGGFECKIHEDTDICLEGEHGHGLVYGPLSIISEHNAI
jgi:hypothetical protein